jgi:hypothetical protein
MTATRSAPFSLRTATLGALLVAVGCANAIEPYRGGSAAMGGTDGGAIGAGTGGTASGSGGGAPGSGGGPAGSGPGTPASGGRTGIPTGMAGISGATGSGGQAVMLALPWTADFESDAVGGGAKGWVQDPEDVTGKWTVVMDGTTRVLQEQNTVTTLSRIVGGDIAWTDMKVEMRVRFSTVTSSSLALLGVRFNDFDHYYFVHLQGDGAVKIRKRIAGSTTDLVTYKSNIPLATGVWYTLGFGFQGTTVTAYYNGAVVGTPVTEIAASLASGGIMLGIQNGAASFDDVKVAVP